MKRILITGTLLALAVPGAGIAQDAPAHSPAKNAAKTCKALRTAMGAELFKTTFGTNKSKSNAFGKCVSKQAKVEAAADSKSKNACKTEQDDPNFAAGHDGKTFAQFYGTNKNGKNAYGKCVSAKAKQANQTETQNKVNAAKSCKADRKADSAAFAAKWCTGKNAYGKCVSATARANNDEA